MDMKEIMEQKNFVILGDTLNKEKYAYKIKNEMINHGYNVECVGKELESINDVSFDIDVLCLCINPIKGLKLLKESKKKYKMIVIQPGAANDELREYLYYNKLPFTGGCLLVGLSIYK